MLLTLFTNSKLSALPDIVVDPSLSTVKIVLLPDLIRNILSCAFTLAVTLPDTIAKASNEAAKELGVSSTEFIRRAIIHELDDFKTRSEEIGIIKSFNAMKRSAKYSEESKELMDNLFTDLSQEEEGWWNK